MMKSLLFVIFSAALGPSQPRLDPSRAQTDAAEQILQIADAEAGNLSGVDRAYAYWLISQAFAKINSKHEPEVLVKSCNAALAAEPAGADPMLRQKIQLDCLRRMMAVQPKVAAEMLPLADADVRQQVLSADAAKFAKKGDMDAALTMLSSETANGAQYPYGRALEVIKSLPSDDRASKDRVFAQALIFYRQKHSRFDIGVQDMGTLAMQASREVSPGLILMAIDELLDVAREEATGDSHLELTLKNGSDGAAFGSLYQYRLFQLLPVLRSLDPGRADDLVKDNAQLSSLFQKYPGGLQSFSSASPDAQKDSEPFSMALHMSSGPAAGSPSAGLLYFQLQNQANEIMATANKDPEGALKAARLMRDALEPSASVKADLLLRIADVAGKEHTSVAGDALQEVLASVESYSLLMQSRYQILVAHKYLQLGDAARAHTVLAQAAKIITKLYSEDANSDDPNRALKATWPSTVVARACVALAGQVSTKFAQEMILELPDPDLRVFARIELASAMLRIPSYPAIVHERHKQDRNTRVSVFPVLSAADSR